jgi:hypothetical protein
VEAHCPKIVSAHATEFKVIPLVFGCLHILETLGRFSDSLEKGALPNPLVRCQFLIFMGHAVRVVILRQGFDAEPMTSSAKPET